MKLSGGALGLLAVIALPHAALQEARAEVTRRPSARLEIRLVVKPRQPISVHVRTAKNLKKDAWVGIVPAEVPHGSETVNDKHDVSFKRFKGRNGTLHFKAPRKPGLYDFRIHDTGRNGIEVGSSTVFEVRRRGGKPAPTAKRCLFVWSEKTVRLTGAAMRRCRAGCQSRHLFSEQRYARCILSNCVETKDVREKVCR